MPVVAAITTVLLLLAVWRLAHDRAKRNQTGVFGPWPIKKVPLTELDPAFGTTDLGPRPESEIAFLPGISVAGGISDLETWVLCTLAKKSRGIFEFGTCTGKTTYLLARNAPADARVVTITLAPEQIAAYASASGDTRSDERNALKESAFTRFYYSGSAEEKKITQLLGDSKAFDEGPHAAAYDLIFIDGSHAASYVESDSRKALKMIRPGGLIFWHDYRGPRRAPGVYTTLNKLAKDLPLRHAAGTSLVFMRA